MNLDMLFWMLPIGISLLALFVSAVSLGWNIYRDVVLKPRLKMRFSLNQIHHPTFPKPIDSLVLSATNFGPGSIKCSMIQLKESPFWRRLLRLTKHPEMIHDYENPLSAKLPAWLEVGEGVNLLIHWEKDCFLSKPFTHIGLSDSFGQVHWASPIEVRKARMTYRKEFDKDNKAN